MERYHALADATMDTMLESLEGLLDELAEGAFEVEVLIENAPPVRRSGSSGVERLEGEEVLEGE